ncbi:MAG: fasciclin domain-containing protein [Thermonemataceae bacterium]|nr:fasciclin domain-containing protein [Thermonemataceae bacterium]
MRKIHIKILSFILFIAAFASCKRDNGDVLLQPRGERDIVEVMQRETNGDFSMFLEALERTGLNATLSVESGQTPANRYIVFAPNNNAFGALLLGLGYTSVSQADITVLTETVKAHVYQLPSAEKNLKVSQLGEGDYQSLQAGRQIYVNADCDGNYYLNGKTIINFEREAKNGYVYSIDDVILTPASTLAEIINSDPDFAIFNQLVAKAGLTGLLEDMSQVNTLFIPPNDVLLNSDAPSVGYPINLNPANFNTDEEIALLDSILRYHILPGRVFALSVCTQKPYVTLLGQDLQLDINGNIGGEYNDWTTVTTPNAYIAKNGVIHKLDFPLLPAKLNIRQRVAELPESVGSPNNSYAIAKQALAITGLDVQLETLDRVTVLLPTDQAFINLLAANNVATIYDLPVDKLTQIMEFHVLKQRLFVNDLLEEPTVRTVQGEDITPTSDINYLAIPSYYGDPSGRIDMKLTNGNIQVIQKVQLPKSVNLVSAP